MKRKQYKAVLSENPFHSIVASVLNKYESGQNIAPNVNLTGVQLPPVDVNVSPATTKLIKTVGFTLAAAIALSTIVKLTSK